MPNLPYERHQSIDHAITCAVRYFGNAWISQRTIKWDGKGYVLLMRGPLH